MDFEELMVSSPFLSWTEAYEDIQAFLRQKRVRLAPSPRFQPGQAVTIASHPAGIIALREGQQEDIERTERLDRTQTFEAHEEDWNRWQFYALTRTKGRWLVFDRTTAEDFLKR